MNDLRDLKAAYLTSPHFHDIYIYLNQNKVPLNRLAARRIEINSRNYILLDGLLFKILDMGVEHVNQYQLLEKASHDLLQGIATLGQGKLPRELVSDTRLHTMLKEVRSMIRKQFPDYELADNSILHYRDMKLVTFSINRETHSLIILFPVFVKDFRQPP